MQMYATLPCENTPEMSQNKIKITKAEHFLKSEILCQCKAEKRKSGNVTCSNLSLGNNKIFKQVHIEVWKIDGSKTDKTEKSHLNRAWYLTIVSN